MHYLCMMQSVNECCITSYCVNSDCDLVSFSARHAVL